MSPTRQPAPIQIYQDLVDQQQQHHQPQQPQRSNPSVQGPHAPRMQQPMQPQPLLQQSRTSKPQPQLAPSAMPLQPMRNGQQQQQQQPYAQIQPSVPVKKQMPTPQQISPMTAQFPPISQAQGYNQYGMMPHISMNDPATLFTDSPQKRMGVLPSSQPLMPAPASIPIQPAFSMWDSNFPQVDQENFMPLTTVPDNLVDFPDPSQARRGMLKRSYSESIPSNDKPLKRMKTGPDDEDVLELPDPENMPRIEDTGHKPQYSYAQMIGMAILRAPGRRLTLASIYDWISTTFHYYRDDPKTGWHNSIRHNLSLNKAFIKQERPKSDAGKGCYWMIQPGMEAQFFKEKPRKTNGSISLGSLGMQQSFSSQPVKQTMPQPVSDAVQPQPWVVQSQPVIESTPLGPVPPLRPQTAPAIEHALPDLDSDATVPASDPALDEDEAVPSKEVSANVPTIPPPSSPPVLNSSPPVVRHHQRTISSPANITRHSTQKQRRSQTGLDDSGYWSSLESSARRPRYTGAAPTSDIGFVPSKKHGRAEEEIARIRSSSHDVTPSGRRFTNAIDAAVEARSSSPIRDPAKGPTTPPVLFKKPLLPPASVSPNAQLRLHRQHMSQVYESPYKTDDIFEHDFNSMSPAFKLENPLFPSAFDDSFFDFPLTGTPLASSPVKVVPSVKRSVQRSVAGILGDASQRVNRLNTKTPSKIPASIALKARQSAAVSGSPLKKSAANTKQAELLLDENDTENALFDWGSFDDVSDGEELDISKGFSKIGSNSASFLKPAGRPALARSATTRF